MLEWSNQQSRMLPLLRGRGADQEGSAGGAESALRNLRKRAADLDPNPGHSRIQNPGAGDLPILGKRRGATGPGETTQS